MLGHISTDGERADHLAINVIFSHRIHFVADPLPIQAHPLQQDLIWNPDVHDLLQPRAVFLSRHSWAPDTNIIRTFIKYLFDRRTSLSRKKWIDKYAPTISVIPHNNVWRVFH